MKKSRVIIITVIVTLVGVFAISKIFSKKPVKETKGSPVKVEMPSRGELVEYVSAPGQIEPKVNIEISAKVSARIKQMPYEEGDQVTKGDPDAEPPVPASVLLRLDSKDLESQLVSAQASRAAQAAQIEVEKANIASQKATLAGQEEALKQSLRELERKKSLFETNDISEAEFDAAKCAVDEKQAQFEASGHRLNAAELSLEVLQHNLKAADARIQQAEESLSHTVITSPIDGVITRVNAEVGELVVTGTMNNAGTIIMEVADINKMVLVAEIDEADVSRVNVGQPASVYVQTFGNHKFEGVVDSIALKHNVSSSGTKYFKTEVLLKPTDKQLYSGLTAHVDIQTEKHEDVLIVPSQAILGRKIDSLPLDVRNNNELLDKSKTFATVVYTLVDGKAKVNPVLIGPSNMTHTLIEKGLDEDDLVIIGPYKVLEGLRNNRKVYDEQEDVKTKSDPNDANSPADIDANDVNDG